MSPRNQPAWPALLIVALASTCGAPDVGELRPSESPTARVERFLADFCPLVRARPSPAPLRADLVEVIDAFFDYEAMARDALGDHRAAFSEVQWREFASAWREYDRLLFVYHLRASGCANPRVSTVGAPPGEVRVVLAATTASRPFYAVFALRPSASAWRAVEWGTGPAYYAPDRTEYLDSRAGWARLEIDAVMRDGGVPEVIRRETERPRCTGLLHDLVDTNAPPLSAGCPQSYFGARGWAWLMRVVPSADGPTFIPLVVPEPAPATEDPETADPARPEVGG